MAPGLPEAGLSVSIAEGVAAAVDGRRGYPAARGEGTPSDRQSSTGAMHAFTSVPHGASGEWSAIEQVDCASILT
jgi:hypothetical protein